MYRRNIYPRHLTNMTNMLQYNCRFDDDGCLSQCDGNDVGGGCGVNAAQIIVYKLNCTPHTGYSAIRVQFFVLFSLFFQADSISAPQSF